MMRPNARPSAMRRRPSFALAALLVLAVAACDAKEILQVEDPDVVRPEAFAGREGLPTLLAGAVGDFGLAYNGGSAGGNGEGQVVLSGLLADEELNTETFPTRIEIDQRSMKIDNTTLLTLFRDLGRARVSAERASAGYGQFEPTNANFPHVLALAGFTYVLFAENYCGGVPFADLRPDGSLVPQPAITTVQMLNRAIAKFDSAITIGTSIGASAATFVSLARVGKGRALLNLGRYADAAAAVAGVPVTFQYIYSHSETTARQNNASWSLTNSVARFGVPNPRETNNGVLLRNNLTVGGTAVLDPRTPSVLRPAGQGGPVGFDGTTQQFLQLKYAERKSNIVVADGVEASLIRAEALLNAGDAQGALDTLNSLRNNAALASLRGITAPTKQGLDTVLITNNAAYRVITAGLGQVPLTLESSRDAQIDQLFRERTYWLWLTSHRLGDLRRLARPTGGSASQPAGYGRPIESVFPSGTYHKGGTYGVDVAVPVPQAEDNNPEFQRSACNTRQP